MTMIEVLDTAIKIGLGALIAALASIISIKLSHKNEIDKLNYIRRQELLESIARNIELFSNSFRKFSNKARHIVDKNPGQEGITDTDFNKLSDISSDVLSQTDNVGSAQSLLLLLGEPDTEKLLVDYLGTTESFMKLFNSQSNVPNKANVVRQHNIIVGEKEKLFLALNEAYEKTGR